MTLQHDMIATKRTLPAFAPGDQIRVWCRIIERDRTRLAPFEGIVIRRRGSGISETFIVRRVTYGEGVERVFPIYAPVLERVELLQQARPRRGRLYFLRTKVGKTRIASAQPGGVKAASEGAPGTEPSATAETTAPAESTAARESTVPAKPEPTPSAKAGAK